MYFCQKNQQFWFSSFFTTTSIRGWFLANLATLPPPHGSPHPTTHLTTYLYVFCVQRAQKPCLMIKIQLLLNFSKVGGGKSILAFFGLWWPSFSATGSPGVAQKCQTRVSPCYTYGNPCQNICRACSINFMQFLNTPYRRLKTYNLLYSLRYTDSLRHTVSCYLRPDKELFTLSACCSYSADL